MTIDIGDSVDRKVARKRTGEVFVVRVSTADVDRINRRGTRLAMREDGRVEFVDGKKESRLLSRWLLSPEGVIVPRHLHVDHVNGDPLDNRRHNLRWLSCRMNLLNSLNPTHPRIGVPGVYFNRPQGRWIAAPSIRGERRTLGTFSSKAEADACARAAIIADECSIRKEINAIYQQLDWDTLPVTPRWEDVYAIAAAKKAA